MRKKIVGIFVCTLLIATALPVIGLTNMKEIEAINGPSLGNSNRQINTIEKPLIAGNRGSLFIQRPAVPQEGWTAFFSDKDYNWRHYDEFWNITSPICDVHWWGFSLIRNDTHWVDCDGAGDMIFDITFYLDDGAGKPGNVACEYINISPTVIPTGIYYKKTGTGDIELYYFEADLDPCCQLSDGWLSVWKIYNPGDCLFAWMVCPVGNWNMWARNQTSGEWGWSNWDLSFILTDGEPCSPDLECEGEIRRTEVASGSTVVGNFTVRNNGNVDSILHWKIDETTIPTWGSNWTITPSASLLTTDMGWLTVDVEFESPPIKNKKFTGKIKVINAADSTDFCEIDVYIKNPKIRTISNLWYQWLFGQFPILKHLFGL